MDGFEAARAADLAAKEGRVHGKFRCSQCGMRSNSRAESLACCRELGPPSSEKVSDARFDRFD